MIISDFHLKSCRHLLLLKGDSVNFFLNSYFDLNFEVLRKTDNSRYANGTDITLGNLGSIGLFSNFKLTTSSGEHLKDISHAHIVSLMYRLLKK